MFCLILHVARVLCFLMYLVNLMIVADRVTAGIFCQLCVLSFFNLQFSIAKRSRMFKV